MKFITQHSIDTVLEDARIYDCVAHSEELKKKGTHWFCLSPFSGEKGTPSLCVNSVKNNFYDYSAGFGGSAITFLMKRHTLGFIEAIIKAAEICGIILDYEEQSEDGKRLHDEMLRLKSVVAFCDQEYQKYLSTLPESHWAKQMLKERGYTQEIIETFRLGYAPYSQNHVSSSLINSGFYNEAIELGISKVKDGVSKDKFIDRIIFPIDNESGVPVGFGGRRSNDDAVKEYSKYINSNESKVYRKERILYGIFQAKKAIAKLEKLNLVEGYTDVISMHLNGAENTVGICGTALTPEHAKLIARYCKHVILFLDGDDAGLKAAQRSIDILVKEGIKVTIVICPEGEDPDSLCKKCDINEFIKNNSRDAILWKANLLNKEAGNPDLPELIKTKRTQHEEIVQKMLEQVHPEAAFEGLSAFDKKSLKSENDKIIREINSLELELKKDISDLPKYEPVLLSQSIHSIANTLHRIPNKIIQKEYVKMVAKEMDQKPNIIQDVIDGIEKAAAEESKKKSGIKSSEDTDALRLPKGADKDQYLEDNFCVIGNAYWFQGDNGGWFKGTNFKITPLFHVEGKKENKRLCEVINTDGHKRLIDFESKDTINFTRFQERLIDEGVFYFDGGVTTRHFRLMTKKLFHGFITATEIKTLGHQIAGFFSFADGVFHDNHFSQVNKYGIVHLESLQRAESEYKADVKHYYIPAFSEIYKDATEDDDIYENDRHFVYKVAPVSLDQWMQQMVTVFGDKGRLGVAFAIAANFRDLFLTNFNHFPLLAGYGQKDSGKSGLGKFLQAFFFSDLLALELNTASLVGMSRRLQRVKNVVTFFDEVREDIDEEKKQMIKGCWNGLGREKGKGADTNKTTTDKINAALYFCGQYVLTGDDGAIPSRCISLMFQNQEYTQVERDEYQKLNNWSQAGLSSFVLDVIKHRNKVKANLLRVYAECSVELTKELQGTSFENRIFLNYLALLTIVKLLHDNFKFPFTYKEYLKLTADSIIENSELISDSDGLAKFWNILEFLSKPQDLNQPNKAVLKESYDYIISRESSFTIQVSKTEKIVYQNRNNDKILFLNFNSAHQLYHIEVGRRKGEDVINQTTLRNYIRSKKYFIGMFPAKRMGDKTPSGYAFNYSIMERMGICDLETIVDNQTVLDNLKTSSLKTITTNPSKASDENQVAIEIPDQNDY